MMDTAEATATPREVADQCCDVRLGLVIRVGSGFSAFGGFADMNS
jgi:hypothetical protein